MKKLAIIGAGKLGQLVAQYASETKFHVVGFFDDTLLNCTVHKLPVLGKINEVKKFYDNKEFDCLFIGIGYKHFSFRKLYFERYKGIIPFANIIHPSAFVHKSVSLGEGLLIHPGCTIDYSAGLEDNVLLNTGVVIAHDTIIKKHSFLAPGCTLAGFIEIGECCNLGIGTVVIDNIKIADNVRTGGGAVVVSDLKEVGLYIGVPAKKL